VTGHIVVLVDQMPRSNVDTILPQQRRLAITAPGYHRGRRAPNKGRKLPAEALTAAEVEALRATFSGRSITAKRDRAMFVLMYREGLKLVQILALHRRDYEPEADRLNVPATRALPAQTIVLGDETARALAEWAAARRELGVRPAAPLFCTVTKAARGRPLRGAQVRDGLTRRGLRAGIEKRVTVEGLRRTRQAERSRERVAGLANEVPRYLDEAAFRAAYPVAHEKWRSAFDLYAADARTHATRIGHDCREALASFAHDLSAHHGGETARGTVALIRGVLESAAISARARTMVTALLDYWRAVSDLAQRQEHGAAKEGESLTREDARRLLHHAALVMYEVDRAVTS
jgi:hypothetical protein